MSVVAAKVYSDKIVVSADSIIVKGWSKRNSNFAKLYQVNGMIIGGCGEAQEMSFMLRFMQTHQPESSSIKDILEFISEFSKWKRELAGDFSVSNSYIMAFGGHLFEIEAMFVHEIKDYVAIGAGEDFATAALYLGNAPEDAVKVACDLSCYVCEPIITFEMPRK